MEQGFNWKSFISFRSGWRVPIEEQQMQGQGYKPSRINLERYIKQGKHAKLQKGEKCIIDHSVINVEELTTQILQYKP